MALQLKRLKLSKSKHILAFIIAFIYLAPTEASSSSGGLKLGGYENVQEKLRQERAEEYRKFLAEVHRIVRSINCKQSVCNFNYSFYYVD